MKDADAGFTLLETIIALVIVASALATIQHALASGWKGLRMARSETQAVEHARHRLAEAGTVSPLAEGSQSGTTADGYAWEVTIARADPDVRLRDNAPPKAVGYWVSATVRWSERGWPQGPRSLELRTLKIGAPR